MGVVRISEAFPEAGAPEACRTAAARRKDSAPSSGSYAAKTFAITGAASLAPAAQPAQTAATSFCVAGSSRSLPSAAACRMGMAIAVSSAHSPRAYGPRPPGSIRTSSGWGLGWNA